MSKFENRILKIEFSFFESQTINFQNNLKIWREKVILFEFGFIEYKSIPKICPSPSPLEKRTKTVFQFSSLKDEKLDNLKRNIFLMKKKKSWKLMFNSKWKNFRKNY